MLLSPGILIAVTNETKTKVIKTMNFVFILNENLTIHSVEPIPGLFTQSCLKKCLYLSPFLLFYYYLSVIISILLIIIIESNECLLDIAILAFGHTYNHEIISSLHSNECEIESIFWITDMTYNSTILENDLNMKQVKIVRENIETYGYTAFLLPLLENNTYSLVIDLDNWSISIEN